MSHIHNLTSHLKNTTITPAPTPHQSSYRPTQNGLRRIYQANKMQQPSRMVSPHHLRLHGQGGQVQKGVQNNFTILPNATTLTPTPNHFTNSAQTQFQQQHAQLQLQQQQRKPTILTHPQSRSSITSSPFINHTLAHQPLPPKSGIAEVGSSGKYFIPGISQNHVKHQNSNAIVNHHYLQNQLTQYNTPTKLSQPQSAYSGSPPTRLHNIQHISKQSNNNVNPRNSNSAQNLQNSNSPSSGGAARVQQNHVNQSRKRIGSNSSPDAVATASVIKSQAKKLMLVKAHNLPQPTPIIVKVEEPSHPIITATENATTSRGPRPFQKGDDVLFTTDDGTFMFGTVGMIHGQTLQILFGDGTQQLASFNKVKLLSCSVEDDDDNCSTTSTADSNHVDTTLCSNNRTSVNSAPIANNNSSKPNHKVGNNTTPPLHGPPNNNPNNGGAGTLPINEEVTCGSCGVVKRVAGKKALNYAPHTKDQFNCRRCVNKSRFCKGSMPISVLPSTPSRGKSSSATTSPTSASKSQSHRRQSDDTTVCFHCEKGTNYNDRLHCNLCERACHLSCLAMTPTPLEGDRFWDVICSACGTQIGDSSSTGRTKVFSCRRSITSWSDVAHLILSCLASAPENYGERFFDLDQDIIPFIVKYTDRLHLPRTYKNIQPESRKEFLSTALHNATLRFLNGSEVHRKDTLWAIRENNNHQGYPLRVIAAAKAKTPHKTKIFMSNNQLHKKDTDSIIKTMGISVSRMLRPSSSPARGGTATAVPSNSGVLTTLGEDIDWTKVDTSKYDVEDLFMPKLYKEGGSSRTVGAVAASGSSRASPKGKYGSEDPDPTPPKLEKYDLPSGTPTKSKADQLVQKAKKHLDSNKRKATDMGRSPSPNSKRFKPSLQPPEQSNGICKTPVKVLSPFPNQLSGWLDGVNAEKRKSSGSTSSVLLKGNKGSLALSESSPSLFGKAVKSAGITPPGSSEKPSLRVRKPKVFDLKTEDKNKKENAGCASPKLLAKLKPIRGGKQSKSNAATQRFSQIPSANGVSKQEDKIEESEFSLLKSPVEDLVKYGRAYTIHCLPKEPETKAEWDTLKKKVAAAYDSEPLNAPPAYLNLVFNGSGAIKRKTKEKSKRNLKDFNSYEVTGKWTDAKGIVRYQYEWKDGFGNDSDEDEGEPLLEWGDLDDPETLLELVDNLEATTIIPNGNCGNTSESNQYDDSNSTDEISNTKPTIKNEKSTDHATVRLHPLFLSGLGLKNPKHKEESKIGSIVIDLTCDD